MQQPGIFGAGAQDGAPAGGVSLSASGAPSPTTDQAPFPAGVDERPLDPERLDTAERSSLGFEGRTSRSLFGLSIASSPSEDAQATGDPLIDGVLAGTKWSGAEPVSFSFPSDPEVYGPNQAEAQNGFARASDALIQAASRFLAGASAVGSDRAFLAGMSVSDFTDLAFTDAGSGDATIRYAESSLPATAYAYYPGPGDTGGDVWSGTAFTGTIYDLRVPELGNYAYTTVLHELGHALGLKHSNEAGGPANVAAPAELDDTEFSIMSYRSYIGAPAEGGLTNERWGFPQSPMMLDIAGLQTLYGADYGYHSGDTVYAWDPLTGEMSIDGVGQGVPGGGAAGANRVYLTIWDGGGGDTYDMSAFGGGAQIDLRPGQWSVTSEEQRAYIGNGQRARGTVFNALEHQGDSASLIENAVGGAGADTLVGNDARNTLTGNAADDTLTGGAGGDTFVVAPGDGHDVVTDFASGSDKLVLHGVGAAQVALAAATRGGASGVLVSYGAADSVFLEGVDRLATGDVALDGGPLEIVREPPATADTTVGEGPDRLVLKVSEDFYQGHAQYTVGVDGEQIGGVLTAIAPHALGLEDTVTVRGTWGTGDHRAEVSFLNDAWGGTADTDRNLYLDGAAFNGQEVQGATAVFLIPGTFDFGFSGGGTRPPVVLSAGEGPDRIAVGISQDAYLGDAQFTASVDGRRIGDVFTASALRGQGTDTLVLSGAWEEGEHALEIDFLNDAWDGTPETDRNLYVEGIAFNGQAEADGTAALLSAGPRAFAVHKPAQAAVVGAEQWLL